MNPFDKFIDQLHDFLDYKKETGFQTLEISPETLAELCSIETPNVATRQAPPAPATKRPTLSRPVIEIKPKENNVITGKTLEELTDQIRTCSACPLHTTRKNTVPSEGKPTRPDILFVSDFPDDEEDEQGQFYVSEAGKLLEKMIGAMGYKRDNTYITNLVQCRPPNNRIPHQDEILACTPYIKAQIAHLQPKLIVALGKIAVEGLLNKKVAITRLRGTWQTYDGIDLMPTFHPGYLLKVPAKKREVWTDLQAVLAKLGKTPPSKK